MTVAGSRTLARAVVELRLRPAAVPPVACDRHSTAWISRAANRARLVFHFAYTVAMKNDVVPVQIRGILPANSGCALFVGNDEKVFVINVEPQMGAIIGMFLRDTPRNARSRTI